MLTFSCVWIFFFEREFIYCWQNTFFVSVCFVLYFEIFNNNKHLYLKKVLHALFKFQIQWEYQMLQHRNSLVLVVLDVRSARMGREWKPFIATHSTASKRVTICTLRVNAQPPIKLSDNWCGVGFIQTTQLVLISLVDGWRWRHLLYSTYNSLSTCTY